jgi:predicted CXXCH cytochrome family protein
MGHSIGPPVRNVPSGKVVQSESGSVIDITWANGRMIHRLTELGFHADYSIDYQIGAGKVGYSYIARLGKYLLQSPASYYRRYGWDVSPGFKDEAVLDFDRVLGVRCLFCHSRTPGLLDQRRLVNDEEAEAIDCGRCHGDMRQHLDHPSRTNVVNPARLAVRARDSVCEQCHLEGRARVLNPGKSLQDFHPGEELETALTVYVDDRKGPAAGAVSQVEQLALSRCARESAGKLWCGTCHDPHGAKTNSRASEIKAICSSCHPKLSQANHLGGVSTCVTCHMPRLRPKDVAHAASTDHRILARPAKQTGDSMSGSVRAWHEPEVQIRQRNLGLADLEASAAPGLQTLGEAGGRFLEALPDDQRENDPAVLAALGDVALSRGRTDEAEVFFRNAFHLAPSNAEYAMYLGIALKEKGDSTGAVSALQNAIAIDASLQRAYLELAALYAKQGKRGDAATVLNRYLQWNPRSVLIRSTLEGLP